MSDSRYTAIVLVSKAAPYSRELYEAVRAAGFEIATERTYYGHGDRELPVECFLPTLYPETAERLQAARVKSLSQLASMEFKRVRSILTPHDDDAYVFRGLCEIFKKIGLTFADLDPARLECWTTEDWQKRGLDGRTAGVLIRLGILGEQMLVAFTPDELHELYGIGGERYVKLLDLQARLRRPRPVR